MNEYKAGFKNYRLFSGRATRRDYWMFALFNSIAYGVLLLADYAIGTASGSVGVLSGIYAFASFLPQLAVSIRRLHDTGMSGWITLVAVIPFGSLFLLIQYAKQGDLGDNRFGPAPGALPAL